MFLGLQCLCYRTCFSRLMHGSKKNLHGLHVGDEFGYHHFITLALEMRSSDVFPLDSIAESQFTM